MEELNKRLQGREEGIVAKMEWCHEGVEVYIVTAAQQMIEKYAIIEDMSGVYYIRTFFY